MTRRALGRALVGLLLLSVPLLPGLQPPGPPADAAGAGFAFAAAGDLAWNGDTAASLGRLTSLPGLDFFLALGDLGYSSNAPGWCGFFKQRFPNFAFVTGNHDTSESGPGLLYGPRGYVANCPFTLGIPLTGQYGVEYSFDYPVGSPLARFILVAPGIGGEVGYDYSPGSPHYAWVADTIDGARASGIPWVIVGMHKPCLNAGSHGCSMPAAFEAMLLAKGVDLVLQGHDHNYQRTKQLTCETTGSYDPRCVANGGPANFTKGRGTVKVIAGTFGASFYSINRGSPIYPYFAAAQASAHGFVRYRVTATRLEGEFVASTGSYVDAFAIGEPGGPPRVTIDRPLEGEVLGATPAIASGSAAAGAGAELRDVEVRVNGGPWRPANGTAAWSAPVDLSPGVNRIEARASDTRGTASAPANVTVRYLPPTPPAPPGGPPTVAIAASATSGSVPLTIAFSAQGAAGAPPYAYLWDFGDGSRSTAAAPHHTFVEPGTYTVTLILTDTAGRSAVERLQVRAEGPPAFPAPSPLLPIALAAGAGGAAAAALALGWRGRRRRGA